MYEFEGKSVIVTGAAQGMGREIATAFTSAGASVLLFDSDGDALEATTADLRDLGRTVHGVTGDVARREEVRRAVDACVERFGQLDVMVAQAGIADQEPLLDIGDESWRRILDVNLTGVFLSVQEAARAMAPRRRGAIVVTSSTNAFFVESHTAHYSASKGGAVAFARAAAIDLAPVGIRVNVINPGMINTRLASFVVNDPVEGPEYLKRVPLGRFGEPAEVADAVLYLASDASSYVTGETLVIDGGVTLGVTFGFAGDEDDQAQSSGGDHDQALPPQ